MSEHDHNAAANAAIRATVKEMRPGISGGWMILVPAKAPMSMPDDGQWHDFLGRVLARYNADVSPCTGPSVESLVQYHTKQLIALRDAIVDGTKCK